MENNTQSEIQNEECCPKFDPIPWDSKVIEWNNKRFIKDKVFTLFFMPLNFGSVMSRITKKAEDANAMTPDAMCLSDHTSNWNIDVYLAVTKEVPGAVNADLSGKYLSNVYEGDFRQTGEWMKDAEQKAKEKGLEIKKWFMWYTTCPKCAKKYGKNYVVVLGMIA